MDDWRQKIQHSLRKSHLFLAVLSPSYLASPYCRWQRFFRGGLLDVLGGDCDL